MHWFETTFKMLGRAVFEIKRCSMVKRLDFEAEKKIKINAKNPYGHFLARNGSKSTITTQKSGKVNKVLYCCRLLLILEKWMDITQLDISASKSCSLTMRPPLTSKTALPNILKTASNQWVSSKDWWKVWIFDRDRTKTRCPQQWVVTWMRMYH